MAEYPPAIGTTPKRFFRIEQATEPETQFAFDFHFHGPSRGYEFSLDKTFHLPEPDRQFSSWFTVGVSSVAPDSSLATTFNAKESKK